MEELLEILEGIEPTIDYHTEDALIDEGYLDSLAILSLVAELEYKFDISITPIDLVPENFNSAEAMWDMIQNMQKEK